MTNDQFSWPQRTGKKKERDSGEDGTNGEESLVIDEKKRKSSKGKIRINKKHVPRAGIPSAPAHSQVLILDNLPPHRQILSRVRCVHLITLRISIDGLFLITYAQNRKQHLLRWIIKVFGKCAVGSAGKKNATKKINENQQGWGEQNKQEREENERTLLPHERKTPRKRVHKFRQPSNCCLIVIFLFAYFGIAPRLWYTSR